jgi:hypothetical protein
MAASRMLLAIWSVENTSTGGRLFGTMVRVMVRRCEAPMAAAASA